MKFREYGSEFSGACTGATGVTSEGGGDGGWTWIHIKSMALSRWFGERNLVVLA